MFRVDALMNHRQDPVRGTGIRIVDHDQRRSPMARDRLPLFTSLEKFGPLHTRFPHLGRLRLQITEGRRLFPDFFGLEKKKVLSGFTEA